MRPYLLALCLVGIAVLSGPAYAAPNPAAEIRWADKHVAYQARKTRLAVQSGDTATIAVERANLQAARAVAWSKRHPAKAPIAKVAVN